MSEPNINQVYVKETNFKNGIQNFYADKTAFLKCQYQNV